MELSSREAKERKGHKDRQVGAQFHPCEGLFWSQFPDLLLTHRSIPIPASAHTQSHTLGREICSETTTGERHRDW